MMKIGHLVRNLNTCRARKVNSRASSAYFRKENSEITEKNGYSKDNK